MNIALIGYGKMGKAIESIALERGHSVVVRVGREGIDAHREAIEKADVAIEFTAPIFAFDNVVSLLQWGVPTVSGTTGWNDRLKEAEEVCVARKGRLVVGSNFSVGVQLFFKLNAALAGWMTAFSGYSASIHEVHHTAKKDVPSGTAITLKDRMSKENSALQSVEISHERIDPTPGTHTVRWDSTEDTLLLEHQAHGRMGFAVGAVVCAERLVASKSGVYNVAELLFEKVPT